MASVSLQDRIVSAIAYFSCGIFSIIWIIFANITHKHITPFLSFNLYQAIFFSVVLAVISLLYSIVLNILLVVPVIKHLIYWFDLYFNKTPLFSGYTISGSILLVILIYLIILSLMGRRPYIPVISDIVNINFGG